MLLLFTLIALLFQPAGRVIALDVVVYADPMNQ